MAGQRNGLQRKRLNGNVISVAGNLQACRIGPSEQQKNKPTGTAAIRLGFCFLQVNKTNGHV
ncbi:MAG: hypothetical protein KFF46_04625 [Desulfobacterales bacterium]|nr:hypothetical protein [Desulfobacterales bacterium]